MTTNFQLDTFLDLPPPQQRKWNPWLDGIAEIKINRGARRRHDDEDDKSVL